MKYTATPGIVQTKICGQFVLIPTRAAYDRCKTMQILPMLWAGTYSMISKNESMDKILTVHRIFKRKKSDAEILAEIEDFCEKLVAKGFLLRTEDDAPDDNSRPPQEAFSPSQEGRGEGGPLAVDEGPSGTTPVQPTAPAEDPAP